MIGHVEVLSNGAVRIDQTAIDECLLKEVGPETHDALVFRPFQDDPRFGQISFAETGVIEDEDMCDLEEGQDGYHVSSDLAADAGFYECWATRNSDRPRLSVDLSLPVEYYTCGAGSRAVDEQQYARNFVVGTMTGQPLRGVS